MVFGVKNDGVGADLLVIRWLVEDGSFQAFRVVVYWCFRWSKMGLCGGIRDEQRWGRQRRVGGLSVEREGEVAAMVAAW